MPDPAWRVHSFYVNVKVGDFAVHLLVDGKHTEAPDKSIKVKAAVLVDGGTSSSLSVLQSVDEHKKGPIHFLVDYIQTCGRYTLEGKQLRFDSIVVSHWDEDHYGMLVQTLVKDEEYHRGKHETIPYLRWDANNKPLTYLYAPNSGDKLSNGRELNGPPKSLQVSEDKKNKQWTISVNNNKKPILLFRFAAGTKTTEDDFFRVLGVDFFTNELLPASKRPKEGKAYFPLNLIADNAPTDADRPRMYGIGVCAAVLGKMKVKSQLEPDGVGLVSEGSTRTNKVSIAAAILWRPGGSDPWPVCSHFCAGDAHQANEERYLQWLRASQNKDQAITKITTIKISHHGARGSTPLRLISPLDPATYIECMNAVVSNPDDQYFHPAWELVFGLDAAFKVSMKDTSNTPMLLATKFPFYLLCDKGKWALIEKRPKMINTKAFDATSSKFLTALDSLYKELGIQSDNPRARYKEPNIDKPVTLLGQLLDSWDSYCFPTAKDVAISQGALVEADPIEFLRITSSRGTDDGDVYTRTVKKSLTPLTRRQPLRTTKKVVPLVKSPLPNRNGVPVTKGTKKKEKQRRGLDLDSNDGQLDFNLVNVPQEQDLSQQFNLGDNRNEQDMVLINAFPDTDSDDESTKENSNLIDLPSPIRPPDLGPQLPLEPHPGLDPLPSYLVASSVGPGQVPRGIQCASVQGSDWDWFIETLHFSVVSLQSASLVAGPNTLHKEDDLGRWLCDNVGTDSMACTLEAVVPDISPWGSTFSITGFQLSFSLPQATPTTPPTTTRDGPCSSQPLLTFHTAEATIRHAFDAASLADLNILPGGLRKGGTALILALDPATAVTPGFGVSLADLASFANLSPGTGLAAVGDLAHLRFAFAAQDGAAMAQGKRNAIWFIPQMRYRTVIRLQLEMTAASLDTLNTFLSPLLGGEGCSPVKSCDVIMRRSATCNFQLGSTESSVMAIQGSGELILCTAIEVHGLTLDTIIAVSNSTLMVTLTVREADGESVFSKLLSWLERVAGVASNEFDFRKWLNPNTNADDTPGFSGLTFRRVQLSFFTGSGTETAPKFQRLQLDVQVKIHLGGQEVLLLLSFAYDAASMGAPGVLDRCSLKGRLWTKPAIESATHRRALPDWEQCYIMEPLGKYSWPTGLDLARLAGFESKPRFIPTNLEQAGILITGRGVAFTAALRTAYGSGEASVPVIRMDALDLAVSYAWGKGLAAAVAFSFLIHPLPEPGPVGPTERNPARILGEIEYSNVAQKEVSGSWMLHGRIESLCGYHLYQFFDKEAQGTVAQLLAPLEIRELDIRYHYDANQVASSFDIQGRIIIADKLQLNLDFKHQGDDNWEFDATLGEATPEGTLNLGELIKSITSSETDLPTFITDIPIIDGANKSMVGLSLKRNAGPKPGTNVADQAHLVFTVYVKLGSLVVQYIQFRTMDDASTTKTKHVLVASVQSLPAVEVPLVGNLTQPFDALLCLWASAELSESEQLAINEVQPVGLHQLPTKRAKPDGPLDAIAEGLHLMLLLRDTRGVSHIALDYCLWGSSSQEMMMDNALPTATAGSESGMAAYSKTLGPLTVRNLGLGFDGRYLAIRIDASVVVGPIALDLLGLALRLDMKPTAQGSPGSNSDPPVSLFHLPKPQVGPLEGMAVSYDRTPLALAGMLREIQPGLFTGAVTMGYSPWKFAAAGSYGTVTDPDGGSYKTTFVFAMLEGPLITLAYAQISGVTGGFGYNSALRLPSVGEVMRFPLIKPPATTPNEPNEVQDWLLHGDGTSAPWFRPQRDSLWVAAGLSVTAFKMLQIDALAVVEWDPSIRVALIGVATACIPPVSARGGGRPAFAQVQLAIEAVVDVDAGTLKIDAQLTPASYLLDPNCHLTGGCALYSWFSPDDDLSGDWVFTLGGYHRAFHPPAHYPKPPRLGISWDLGPIAIRGEAYFAVTPQVCMGGGRWAVSLSAGPLEAHYEAFVDFLVNYHPFSFIASGGVSVGVHFTLDLWLVTLHIAVDIGATLYLEGPPIHGVLHVDFWVFGFDISIGTAPDQPPAKLSLAEFIDLVYQTPDPSRETFSPSSAAVPKEKKNRHVLSVESGLLPQGTSVQSAPSSTEWKVDSSRLVFSISCPFPIESASVITQNASGDDQGKPTPVDGSGNAIYARPMQRPEALGSKLAVRIRPLRASADDDEEEDEANVPQWEECKGSFKNLPAGLWGQYDAAKDPSRRALDPDSAPDMFSPDPKKTTVKFLTGVQLKAPKPMPPPDSAESLPAFDHALFMVSQLQPVFEPEHLTKRSPELLPRTPSPQLKEVREQWETRGKAAGAEAVKIWTQLATKAMGWPELPIDPVPESPEKSPREAMLGEPPTVFTGSLEQYLLSAPLLSVG